jgi:transcriptional regulator with XRE-family HTH domain
MRVKLANLREGRNLTQAEISKKANISQGYYSDIESGTRCPSPNVANRIAMVLELREEEMFRVFYLKE